MKEKAENLSDEILLLQYKNTLDKGLIGVLYKRYAHLVLAVCFSYFKNKDESKDAVIHIFEKLFTELQKREIKNFKIWLTFVSKNYCISELRKKNTEERRQSEFMNEPVEEEDASELQKKEVQYNEVEKLIEQLPDKQKVCIKLFYYENQSYEQISAQTGFTANEVKSYIQNGKRNLKINLSAK